MRTLALAALLMSSTLAASCGSASDPTATTSEGDNTSGDASLDNAGRGDVLGEDPCDDPDGDGYGPGCVRGAYDCAPNDPAVNPGTEERCGNGVDDDCDDAIDEGCGCAPGSAEACYTGPEATEGVGRCRAGFRLCEEGGVWGPCELEVLPRGDDEALCDGVDDDCDGDVDEGLQNACGECGAAPTEVCGDGLDNDCDGVIDQAEAGCDCDERTDQPCYSGPPQTLGVGACAGGVMDCVDGAWDTCVGERLPAIELCNGLDDDCDGRVDEGALTACGDCTTLPREEECNGLDDDCDGLIDEGVRLVCGLCPGEAAAEEICGNNVDDDCDGRVDQGCPCGEGEPTCYPGPPEVAGVGACTVGARACDETGEFWGACEGYVLPRFEVCNGLDDDCDGEVDEAPNGCSVCVTDVETCNGLDDDCDGQVDEGLRNACGQCFDEVTGETVCDGEDDNCNGLIDEGLLNACGTCAESCYEDGWSDEEDWNTGTFDGIGDDLSEGLRLGTVLLSRPDLWVANTGEATVSRINTDTLEVVGTYPADIYASRTAVDFEGNVFVANRAFFNQGTLTKVLAEGCTGDECVAWNVPIGDINDIPRGLAIDRFGDVWVGTYHGEELHRVDPTTGEIINTYDIGIRVYGLAIDAEGIIWIASQSSDGLGAFDAEAGEMIGQWDIGCNHTYGVAVDGRGDVWFGNWTCNNVVRLVRSTLDDFGGPTFRFYSIPGLRNFRGVAVDAEGFVYFAASGGNRLAKLDPERADRFDAGEMTEDGDAPISPWVWTAETCEDPIGVGIANDGAIWSVCRAGDRAQRFSPEGDLLGEVSVGSQPYSYSDMTGFQLRNFTAPSGVWTAQFDCGRPSCQFDTLRWDALTPEGTEVSARVRTAPAPGAAFGPWSPSFVGSPVALASAGLASGQLLEVEVRLTTSERDVSPLVRSVSVEWQRP